MIAWILTKCYLLREKNKWQSALCVVLSKQNVQQTCKYFFLSLSEMNNMLWAMQHLFSSERKVNTGAYIQYDNLKLLYIK